MKKLILAGVMLTLFFVSDMSASAVMTTVHAAPVPMNEPGTMMLLGFGLFSMAVYGKRHGNRHD